MTIPRAAAINHISLILENCTLFYSSCWQVTLAFHFTRDCGPYAVEKLKCKERHLICGPNNLIHRGQRSVCMVSLDLQELQQSAQPLIVSWGRERLDLLMHVQVLTYMVDITYVGGTIRHCRSNNAAVRNYVLIKLHCNCIRYCMKVN